MTTFTTPTSERTDISFIQFSFIGIFVAQSFLWTQKYPSNFLESLPEYSVSSCLLMNESKIMFCLWKESPKSNKWVTRDRGYYLIFPDFCWLFQRQNISYHQICCIYETSRKEIVWKPFIQSPYGFPEKNKERERGVYLNFSFTKKTPEIFHSCRQLFFLGW